MGVKKSMDTFFAGLREQTMDGYGSRIVSTPMGPFKWNDHMQLWENVNNGMVLNNISFQDSIMLMDYGSTDGGSQKQGTSIDPYAAFKITYSGDLGNINNVFVNSVRYASVSGPQSLKSNASLITLNTADIEATANISLNIISQTGTEVTSINYSINNDGGLAGNVYSSPFTIQNGDTLKIAIVPTDLESGSGTIQIINNSYYNEVITTVDYSFAIS